MVLPAAWDEREEEGDIGVRWEMGAGTMAMLMPAILKVNFRLVSPQRQRYECNT